MKIEIWSDITCPFCYIGKKNFEKAIITTEAQNSVLEWRSFELDPFIEEQSAPSLVTWLSNRYGKPEAAILEEMIQPVTQKASAIGLAFNLENAVVANTHKAHQLLHFAKDSPNFSDLQEAMMRAYFCEGKNINNNKVLLALVDQCNLEVDAARKVLNENALSDAVKLDQAHARQIGISGVPFYLLNEKYAVQGAQPESVFIEVIEKITAKTD